MKKGLARFLNKQISVYSNSYTPLGKLEIRGTLKLGVNGFLEIKEDAPFYPRTAYISKRTLIKRKRCCATGDIRYAFFIRGNYDIFTKPNPGGFEYKF